MPARKLVEPIVLSMAARLRPPPSRGLGLQRCSAADQSGGKGRGDP